MKRRAASFLTVLALCLSLCPMRALAAGSSLKEYSLTKDLTTSSTYVVAEPLLLNMKGYAYTVENKPAVSVRSGAELHLTYGTIKSTKGTGIEIQSGCSLYIDDPGMTVIGTTYGLDFASGAEAELSGGTFTGNTAAIRAADGDYGALLADGRAFFDEDGEPVPLTGVKDRSTVSVKTCTAHVYEYTPGSDAPNHTGTCLFCGAKTAKESCAFSFSESGYGQCAKCGHTVTVTVTQPSGDPVYNGKAQPDSVSVTVVLDSGKTGSKTLAKGSDYTVTNTSGKDAGETIAVTVTGVTYSGTYTKTFHVTRARPEITWDTDKTDPLEVKYDGSPVDESDLPSVNITVTNTNDGSELQKQLYFSYRKKDADTDFIKGLPTDAGTYEIKANLPETQNYYAASSDSITLTINKIKPITSAPKALKLVYTGDAQELVTRGAARDGATVLFATSADGPWSTTIPTGTNAGDYVVWYKVEETDNYNAVEATKIDIKIERKSIEPVVELEYDSYVYTGGAIEPKVTVRDPDTWVVLPTSEYSVSYRNNVKVGNENDAVVDNRPTVTVTDKTGGNYDITEVNAYFSITEKDQDGLTITKTPDSVTYGDVFTLETSGGSGNGTVTWKITAGGDVAKVDANSGQITVIGVGTATVQATRTSSDYKEATATWTFTVAPKHVTAIVTADNKVYNGDNTATVHAEVAAQDIVSGDTITITMPFGSTFCDANAGTGKIVDVVTTGAVITVNGTAITGAADEKYIVTIPATATADITKAVTEIKTRPTEATLTYNGTKQALLTAKVEATPTTNVVSGGEAVVVEYSLSKNGDYDTAIPQATDAGSYEVWYRVKGTSNYFGTDAAKVDVTISPKPVTPDITLPLATEFNYVYDGSEKKPTVTVKDGNDMIPDSEYTVSYSNNINAGTGATVTVTARTGGNYTFTKTVNFTITKANAVLTAAPQVAAGLIYNGNPQYLVTAGVATGGSLEYSLDDESDYKTEIPQGESAGTYKVCYKVKGDSNHNDIAPTYVYVTIQPKTVVTPVIQLAERSFTYTGSAQTFGENEITVKDGDDAIPTTEYTVTYSDNINAGTATVHINNKSGGNYTVNGSATFTIAKATAKFTTAPEAISLTYTGKAQTLIKAGVPDGGTAVYSLDGENGPYSPTLPTGTDAGIYTVHYKVQGDGNHEDSTVQTISVTIAKKSVTPNVMCSPATFPYDGTEKTPNIIVTDSSGEKIPDSEYTVTFDPQPRTTVGTYTVIVTARPNGNYTFTTTTGQFNIVAADQAPLSIVTDMAPIVYYGDTFRLSAVGGSGTGAVKWSIASDDASVATIDSATGVVKVTGTGSFTVTAYREGAGGYSESNTDSMTFTAKAKPVTAVVTAKDKVYDGNTDATVTVTVPGTSITVENVTGTFDNENVGTNKIVTINSSNPTVTGGDNYDITYPATTTASITPAVAKVTTEPQKVENLTYAAGETKALVTVGTATGGTMVYSLDDNTYSSNIPTGTNAGSYTVYYKVRGDSNHTDSEVKSVEVTIAKQKVETPQIVLTPSSAPYDGMEKKPTVTVRDDTGHVIPDSEYTITYGNTDWKSVGDHTVTITNVNGGNYDITQSTATFTITEAEQGQLTITGKPSLVYYGDKFMLDAVGGSGTGDITWSITEGGTIATIDSDSGLVEVTGVGTVTITATKAASASYGEITATCTFTTLKAAAKVENPPIAAPGLTYTRNELPLLAVGGSTVNGIGTVVYCLNDANGTYSDTIPTAINAGTYTVWYKVEDSTNWTGTTPNYVEVTIGKATPTITAAPTASSITSGQLLSESKLEDGAASVDGTFAWKDGNIIPINGASYEVKFTPTDTANYNSVTGIMVQVTVTGTENEDPGDDDTGDDDGTDAPSSTVPDSGTATPPSANPGTERPSTQTTVRDGAASTVLNSAAGNELADEAAANQSENVVIKPEITGSVAKTEVSIPASAVGRIGNETDASLTVSTPIADVTIPNGALSTLSRAGGAVSIAAERVENTVVLTLTAGGRVVGDLPGGLTLTVPAEDAGPGTVAVLVHEDGTREVIRKSVSADGGVRIPLDGSATVELVDNSRTFTDVPADNWAADAVSFVSAHEMFNGTGETTFSPGKSMSRAMLATVLHNLESNPGTAFNGSFADVGGDAWYAESVSWAAGLGIVNGYGNGSFGANDPITREQLAVMLWRYAGSPSADGQTLDFTDADQASGYAVEALRWAAANGILSGYGNGRIDPAGQATRAQAAQMLKNFLENT